MSMNRFKRSEIVACTYASMYGSDDLGGMSNISRALGRSAGSLKMKCQNIVAMLRGRGVEWHRAFSPLTGMTDDFPVKQSDWDVVEPLTLLTREELLAICRLYVPA